jgi:hypothetical protein
MAFSSALIVNPFNAPAECLFQPIEVSSRSEQGTIITQHTVICASFGMTAKAGGTRVRAFENQCGRRSVGALICAPVLVVWRSEYCMASLAIPLSTFMECRGDPGKQKGAQ